MANRENPYLPYPAVIQRVKEETSDIKTFSLAFKDKARQTTFYYRPGQFVQVSILGLGEAPISLSSAPCCNGSFELSVKRSGRLTERLHQLKPGDEIGIRGPYGNGFPYEEIKGKNIVFVGGGIGLAPLRSLINSIIANRDDFGSLQILYGARTPADLVFKDELNCWSETDGVEVLVTVDIGDERWTGNVGVVTTLFAKTRISADNTAAFICGPPVMIPFVIRDLLEIGLPEEWIICTLERHMKCGIGKCGHCNIGSKYVCLDGPVFNYRELKQLLESF